MLSAAVQHSMDDIQPLVKTLICESECTTLKSLVHGSSALTNQGKGLGSASARYISAGRSAECFCFLLLQWSVESSSRRYSVEKMEDRLISPVSCSGFNSPIDSDQELQINRVISSSNDPKWKWSASKVDREAKYCTQYKSITTSFTQIKLKVVVQEITQVSVKTVVSKSVSWVLRNWLHFFIY